MAPNSINIESTYKMAMYNTILGFNDASTQFSTKPRNGGQQCCVGGYKSENGATVSMC